MPEKWTATGADCYEEVRNVRVWTERQVWPQGQAA